jgi:hypothetical protein
MITIPGQLAIKTIHGRNGDFNVGRLATSIGEFVVKNAELDQYAEGKYEGDFAIAEIRPSTYSANGRMVIEIRALLGGMTLSNIDALSRDDARRLSPQEVDPIDEEAQTAAPTQRPPQGGRKEEGAQSARPAGRYHAVRQRTGGCVCRGFGPCRRWRRRGAVRRALAAGRCRQARCHRGSARAASAARPPR